MTRRIFVPLQLVTTPALIGLIVWMELKQPFPLFRLATFAAATVLLGTLAAAFRDRIRDALIVLASLGFGVTIAEGAAIALEPDGGLTITRGWSVRQPIMGWGPERAGRYHAEKRAPKTNELIYRADYTIDDDLLRRTVSASDGRAIVFFGDSYTFGDGVEDWETLPQQFADQLKTSQRVVNLAFTGYGPQQFLREMETGRFDSVIGGEPRLFIFLTAPWHAERTGCKAYWTARSPRYAVEDGRVTFAGQCFEGANLAFREWLQDSAAFRFLIEPYRHQVSRDDVELYVRILESSVATAKAKYGAPTLIPYLRVPPDYLKGTGFTDEAIMERLRKSGAIVVDASLAAEEATGEVISIKGDGHPTPLANRLRAAMIKSAIEHNLTNVLLSELN